MAEQEPEGLDLPDQDAGAAFRTEMWLANTMLGYWKHLTAVLATFLLGVLVYGVAMDQYKKAQKVTTGEVAGARAELAPEFAMPGRITAADVTDEQRAEVVEIAARLVAIGADSSGTASVEAYVEAAELYRMIGDKENQRKALEAAVDDARGALRYSVEGALANLDLEEDKGDAAIERLRKLSAELDGFLAEQALIDLGLALEHLERANEALIVYEDFMKRFPDDSERKDKVRARMNAINGSGA